MLNLLRIFRPAAAPDLHHRKPLCNGAATGTTPGVNGQCIHYWPSGHLSGRYAGKLPDGSIVEFDDNPELRRQRRCTLTTPALDLGDNLKAYCPRYEASGRAFDPVFEAPSPKDLDLPSMLEGGGAIPTPESLMRTTGPTENGTVKDWDLAPGAPVREGFRRVEDPEATAVAQALANEAGGAEKVAPEMKTEPLRGFVHAEVANHKTACSVKAPGRALAAMFDKPSGVRISFEAALSEVNCPGCLSIIADREGVKGLIRERMEQVAAFESRPPPGPAYNPSVTLHAEVLPGVTACGIPSSNLVRLGPPFLDGQVSPSIQPPTCPSCFAAVKTPSVLTAAVALAQQSAAVDAEAESLNNSL